ncbi:hypothetical protein PHYBLDRAFT_151164 [Phycomyces blakesleeanus NRRL 1555(-)]|uniref:Uncharacterized protein n=1 Tax=Phycomyces blakesleeanus (strain ATCC 8743b / DSM 1359 / FGSC 10004 / NBRC 33097 / NRRL 1555) TaxID=763407 RepID=A0A162N1W0_PHYB8|nr:hypothetical protein PHYBLDRAFT_151164 [Phycomyces blakesleeanus NRRL 1555(-)]OAD67648.1 hypothetical protein PHYBLDRAFT_151164 [Phycomyces blakesleeanus NRRL 1555(-)]|eukprot:XP_018285688.1 hypothetical protein PHYBLDRAFT_151164 [Phycomyces blakesleeanus NRRL 1555(-)]
MKLEVWTCHSVDSLSMSTSMSPVPPIMAHSRTKPPKKPAVWYPSPETGQTGICLQHT